MLDELSCTEIERLHLELLPARTVMSMFATTGVPAGGSDATPTGSGANGNPQNPFAIFKDLPVLGKMLAGA
jgi:hypothetical protein